MPMESCGSCGCSCQKEQQRTHPRSRPVPVLQPVVTFLLSCVDVWGETKQGRPSSEWLRVSTKTRETEQDPKSCLSEGPRKKAVQIARRRRKNRHFCASPLLGFDTAPTHAPLRVHSHPLTRTFAHRRRRQS